jgi:hypothetical protein
MSACIIRRRFVADGQGSASIAIADHFVLQATRVRALQHAYRKAEAAHPRDDAPKAGAIRNLGLLDKEEDTKVVLGK